VKLRETRARVAQRRVEAFVDYSPMVCGMRLQPVTLASYSRLIAFCSPFVCGLPIDFRAVFEFCWLHSPDFSAENAKGRRACLRRVYRYIHPRFGMLNAFCRLLAVSRRLRWLRHFTRPTPIERLAEAVEQIRHLLDEATHDLPRGGEDDQPAPVAFHAQILNTFRRTLALPYAEAEAMPMKRLVQLFRESMHASSGGKGLTLIHREEAQIWREHLARAQAKATKDQHG
jgi:hypothetical protein